MLPGEECAPNNLLKSGADRHCYVRGPSDPVKSGTRVDSHLSCRLFKSVFLSAENHQSYTCLELSTSSRGPGPGAGDCLSRYHLNTFYFSAVFRLF